jgi:hypothetical protein
MKLAVLFRGPVRPNASRAGNNMAMLVNSLQDHDITTYLWSWDGPQSREISCCDVTVLEPEPDEKFLQLHAKHNMGNSFKQYWSAKRAIEYINSREKYDYIIHSRSDMRIVFDKDNITDWFDQDHYVTLHYHGTRASYVNDQIGSATPEIMQATWDYKTLDLLNHFTSKARQPEDVLDQIIVMNGVKLKIGKLKLWQLEEDRHT